MNNYTLPMDGWSPPPHPRLHPSAQSLLLIVTLVSALIGNQTTESMLGNLCVGNFVNVFALTGLPGTLGATSAALKMLLSKDKLRRFGFKVEGLASRGAREALTHRETPLHIVDWEKPCMLNQAIFRVRIPKLGRRGLQDGFRGCVCASYTPCGVTTDDPLSIKLHCNRFWLAGFNGGIVTCHLLRDFNSTLTIQLVLRGLSAGVISFLANYGLTRILRIEMLGREYYVFAFCGFSASVPVAICFRFWLNTVILSPSLGTGQQDRHTHSDYLDSVVYTGRKWAFKPANLRPAYCWFPSHPPTDPPTDPRHDFPLQLRCKPDHVRVFSQMARDNLSDNRDIAAYCETAYRSIQGYTNYEHYQRGHKRLKRSTFFRYLSNGILAAAGILHLCSYLVFLAWISTSDNIAGTRLVVIWTLVQIIVLVVKIAAVAALPHRSWTIQRSGCRQQHSGRKRALGKVVAGLQSMLGKSCPLVDPENTGTVALMMGGTTCRLLNEQLKAGVIDRINWDSLLLRTASMVPPSHHPCARIKVGSNGGLTVPSLLVVSGSASRQPEPERPQFLFIYAAIMQHNSPRLLRLESQSHNDLKERVEAILPVPAILHGAPNTANADRRSDLPQFLVNDVEGEVEMFVMIIAQGPPSPTAAKPAQDPPLYIGLLPETPGAGTLHGGILRENFDSVRERQLIIRHERLSQGRIGACVEMVTVHLGELADQATFYELAPEHQLQEGPAVFGEIFHVTLRDGATVTTTDAGLRALLDDY
ncbi:hypothetical protein CBOM_03510 [Ceraceosorus bombacis]|uniref:Uncharacterized protein n=1 Tax=Ceraceosorus bombacis TaxID=401625 RepID=A0A0P1BHC3_9BASI|nr:hypothetical protein CBOM_03510 [Ceraceosorus bombacis]